MTAAFADSVASKIDYRTEPSKYHHWSLSFDGAVAGLGGSPYAARPGRPAPGNIDTLLLVRTIHGAGYETGVDIDALARAAEFARTVVARSRAATPATPEHGP